MKEIKIAIEVLEGIKQEVENEIDDFGRYGRSPDDEDYTKMIELLEKWKRTKSNIECLKSTLEAIIHNALN